MGPIKDENKTIPSSSQQTSDCSSSSVNNLEEKVKTVVKDTSFDRIQEEKDDTVIKVTKENEEKEKKRKERGNKGDAVEHVRKKCFYGKKELAEEKYVVDEKPESTGDLTSMSISIEPPSASSSSSNASSSLSSNMKYEGVFGIPHVKIPRSRYIPENDFKMYDRPVLINMKNLSNEMKELLDKNMLNNQYRTFYSILEELYPKLENFYICSDHSLQQCHAYSLQSNEEDIEIPREEESDKLVYFYTKDFREEFDFQGFVDSMGESLVNIPFFKGLMLDHQIIEENNGSYYAVNSENLIEKIYNMLIAGQIDIPGDVNEEHLVSNDFLYNIFLYLEEAVNGYPMIAHTAIRIEEDVVVGKILGGPVIIHKPGDLLGGGYEKFKFFN